MSQFNNREIALVIWLFVALVFVIADKKVQKSFIQFFKVIASIPIITSFSLMVMYTSALVYFLRLLNLWDISLLKDTVVWFFFTAYSTLINAVTAADKEDSVFSGIAKNFKIMLIVEFALNFYPFSLLVEMLFVPIMATLAILELHSSKKLKDFKFKKLIQKITAFVGLVFIGLFVKEVYIHSFDIIQFKNIKTLLLPPLLTILFIPFVYLSVLYACYEMLFVRVKFALKDEPETQLLVKKQIFRVCRLNVAKIKKISKPLIGFMSRNEKAKDYILFFENFRNGIVPQKELE